MEKRDDGPDEVSRMRGRREIGMGGGEEWKEGERKGEGVDEKEGRVGDVAGMEGRGGDPVPGQRIASIIACTPHLALLYLFGFLFCHYFVPFLARIIIFVTCMLVF
jgi:hypothetical protein